MQLWLNLVLAVQLLTAIAMIGLVLVQQGKGADVGASFGSGASGSLFGATGSANFLSRSTAVCATVFFISTLALAYFGNRDNSMRSGGGSVFERAGAAAPAASAPALASPPAVGQIPTAPAPAAASSPAVVVPVAPAPK